MQDFLAYAPQVSIALSVFVILLNLVILQRISSLKKMNQEQNNVVNNAQHAQPVAINVFGTGQDSGMGNVPVSSGSTGLNIGDKAARSAVPATTLSTPTTSEISSPENGNTSVVPPSAQTNKATKLEATIAETNIAEANITKAPQAKVETNATPAAADVLGE